jgi:hypothetical protein
MSAPETPVETLPRYRKVLAATTLAASLALNGVDMNEAEAITDPTSTVVEAPETASMSDTTYCAPIDWESRHKTKRLLNHPHNFDAPIKNVPHKHTTAAEMAAKRKVAAKRFDLTVYNYRHIYRGLFRDAKHANDKPVATYLQKANQFAQHYGVTVTAPSPVPNTNPVEQITPLNIGTLSAGEQKKARYALTRIIDNLGQLPVEFVKSVGLKHIYLGRLVIANSVGHADMINGGTIYVDPLKYGGPNVISHEFTHLWDARECNGPKGAFQDPQLDALNPVNVYDQYPYDASRQTNRGVYTDRSTVASSGPATILAQKIRHDYAHNHYARAERHWRKYEALFRNVVAIRSYGLKNVAEDKATIGEDMLTPYDYQSIYNAGAPILAKKFAYLLARVYQRHPRFAKYLITVGNNKF